MGKHRKLRSSVLKILHEALTSITPSVAGPFCIQPDKTHSSRDLITGFNSLHHTPHSSAASYGPCSHDSLFLQLQNRGFVEEVAVSVSAAKCSNRTCSRCPSSSSPSSTLPAATSGSDDPADAEFFPSGMINSKRFFFSPCSSKSIATWEGGEVVGFSDMEHLSCHNSPGSGTEKAGEDGNAKMFDTFAKTQEETSAIEEWATSETSEIFLGSTPTAMASRDPYGDFRSSMEEMVMANGLWDWASLKELLHFYLRLNEKKTHGLIVLAFLDLLMQLPLHSCP
ncbi:hypothetical protein Taro_033255 [Colocasia esculenta]|uniref:Transcription repressor n=1 Tax=Colocasia esculenta TaxID=4460 RepID=A0A843W490_COLES|nr:hypothetical protein [Colocasia esculenta]